MRDVVEMIIVNYVIFFVVVRVDDVFSFDVVVIWEDNFGNEVFIYEVGDVVVVDVVFSKVVYIV